MRFHGISSVKISDFSQDFRDFNKDFSVGPLVMASQQKEVAVIGAGVIGLSVATHLLERFPDDLVVTLVADKFSPDTISSDRSGGWILPVDFSKVNPGNPERAANWTRGTMRRLHNLHGSEEGGQIGLSSVSGYYMTDPTQQQAWAEFVHGLRVADQSEIKKYNFKKGRTVLAFTTYTLSCQIYLPWLLKKFTQLGGVTEQRKVHNLSELSSYDIVVNCTGLGARELANDQQVYPVRGHIVSVSAPWVKHFLEEFGHLRHKVYILPRTSDVILGGSYEPDIEDLSVDAVETREIIKRCQNLIPSLAAAQVLDRWVGMRPFRKGGVRLEEEQRKKPARFVVIHCYGHGSDGVTLSWGCAEEVGDMVERYLKTQEKLFPSKL